MDLRTIKTFKTIEKYGSFQRAAEELKYAQSTITTHIKNLEKSLGVLLLDRTNNLQLTDAGRLLSEKGDLLLKTYEDLRSSMADLIDGEAAVLRIGVMEPMASYRFPEMLASFSQQYPHIQISLQIQGSRVLADMVENGELDLAFCAVADLKNGTIFEPLFSEGMGLLVPESHHLSERPHIQLKDLQHEHIIMTNQACPFRGIFQSRLIEEGILLPTYKIEVSNMLAVKYYVQQGLGLGIIPLVAADPLLEGTVIKEIFDFGISLSVGMMSRADIQEDKRINALRKIVKSQALHL